ncbi:MAG: DUF6585 family protein [Chloroflexota bacterium]
MRLGSLIKKFHGRQITRLDVLTLLLPGMLGVLTPLGYGVWRVNYAYTHYGPVAAKAWGQTWFLISCLAALIFLLLSLYRLRLAHQFVAIYQNGLHIQPKPGRKHVLGWKHIKGLIISGTQERFLGITWRVREKATLQLIDDKKITLPSLPGKSEMLESIKEKLYPHLLESMQMEYRAGNTLSFGQLTFDQHGLHLPHCSMYWKNIQQMHLENGALVIKLNNGKQKSIPASQIPNLELLLQLVKQGVYA